MRVDSPVYLDIILRAPSWQLVARCLVRLRSTGLTPWEIHVPRIQQSFVGVSFAWGAQEIDFTKMFTYTALAWSDGGYTLMRQFTEAI